MTYEEYKEAMKEVAYYRKEIIEAYKSGERVICRSSIDTGRFIEVTGSHHFRWDINDYFLGDAIPLTDKDAAVWPRMKIMVRDFSDEEWQGPFDFLGVDDNGDYLCPDTLWKFARRCTKEEGL